MENVVVVDVFDDEQEQDEEFDEGMEAVGTVFCVLDDEKEGPDDWNNFIFMIMSMMMIMFLIIYVYHLIVSEGQGGSCSSLCNVNQGSRQQQKTLKIEIDIRDF